MKYEINMTVEINDKDRDIRLAIESALDEYGMFAKIQDVYKLPDNDY